MICYTQSEIKNALKETKKESGSLGFVPTMGALHSGHLSLVEQALLENDHVVISIFVNPTQFNNPEDLKKYPRTLDKDISLIKTLPEHSRIIVFSPDSREVYGSIEKAKVYNFGLLDQVMEGANRPGHFNGVGTILEFLFKLISPDNAYFGEKDFQQLLVVKSLVKQLALPINVVGCPIKREPNKLAMSSRNERLSKSDRQKAGLIYNALLQAKKLHRLGSTNEASTYVNSLFESLNEFDLEYFNIVDQETLSNLKKNHTSHQVARAFIVVSIGGVRLIDNMRL